MPKRALKVSVLVAAALGAAALPGVVAKANHVKGHTIGPPTILWPEPNPSGITIAPPFGGTFSPHPNPSGITIAPPFGGEFQGPVPNPTGINIAPPFSGLHHPDPTPEG